MPTPRPRLTPSFVVAVTALVLASGGVGYAAGQITSGDIRDNTIQSRDVKNAELSAVDIRPESITRSRLNHACAGGEIRVFGGCVRLVSSARSSHQAAIDNCSRRNGRLPTLQELRWIAAHDEYRWADGNPAQYEFSGDSTTTNPSTPVAMDQSGNVISNASVLSLWHHCVTY